MNAATLLKRTANAYMAATLAAAVANDVVRRSPYPLMGLAAAFGLVGGVLWTRRRRSRGRVAARAR